MRIQSDSHTIDLHSGRPTRKMLIYMRVTEELSNDSEYCERVKAYRKKHPVALNSDEFPIDRVIYSTFPNSYFIKQILYEKNNLVLVDISENGNPFKMAPKNLPEDILIFYTMTPFYHMRIEIGKGFACEGQRYNHFPGNFYMDSKIENALDFREYSKHYIGREQCFDLGEVYPYTLVLKHSDECAEFMEDLRTNQNEQGIR